MESDVGAGPHDGSRRAPLRSPVGWRRASASAPLAPGFREAPLWHAGVEHPAELDDPGPLPASADVVVVGAGYCGTVAGAELARRGRSALVLDADRIGVGASTRNGGMVIPELKHGPRWLTRKYGALGGELVDAVFDAFALVEHLVDEWSIDCDYVRTGGLLLAHHERHVPGFEDAVEEWRDVLGEEARFLARDELHEEIGTSAYHAGLLVERTGGLQPAKYHAGLVRRALDAGAVLHGRTRVQAIERRPNGGYRVTTARVSSMPGTCSSRRTRTPTRSYPSCGGACCRSAASSSRPSRSATISRGRASRDGRMVYDAKNFLFYWRLSPDGRMVFGGRTSLAPTTVTAARDVLYREMVRVHPQLAGVALSFAWGGNVAITFDRLPHCGRVPLPGGGDVAYATGCNGTGVALATWFGARAAAWLSGEEPPPAVRPAPVPEGAAPLGARPVPPRGRMVVPRARSRRPLIGRKIRLRPSP